MSSGMNSSQAEEYAKTMTYKEAISNIRTGKGVRYRKATMIKLHELAEIADKLVRCKDCKFKRLYDEGDTKYYYCALEDRPNRNWSVDDTDFCSWGEREGGTND